MKGNGRKMKGKEGKCREIEAKLAKRGKMESKAGKERERKAGNDERPFGRMYVVALLDHRMCAEQCEGIYLITSGWLGGYLWMLSIDGFCNECALAHMKMQSMISFKVC